MALSTINASTGLTDGTVTSVKLADFAAAVDLNGVELILDADQDTSITADTDDRIDFKIANVEHFSFSNSSGDTVVKPMVDAKDIIFQQYDGNILLTIDDAGFVGIHNSAAGPGVIRIYEDTDLGSHYSGFTVGNLTASVSYVLPAADGSSGEQLTTNGSGVLSWATGGVSLANDANNRVVTGTGSGLNGEANLTFDGSALQLTGTLTVGVDDTGYDVKLFGATSGKSLLWDESADSLIVTGTTTLVGTTNLDAVDIDGAVQLDSTLTVGVNDTGYDVKFFGATAGKSLLWDESADTLIVTGNATISGTATTTGVHTFTAIPVFPNDTIETADIQADAITGAKIADDQIDSEHYVDGSIDTAHLADGQVTIGKLATAVLTGATDIGAGIADADLFLVDDGAGGTLRKTAASRLKTYIGSNAPAFCVIEGGQQTLNHNTYTNLTFGSEIVDSNSAFAANVFTVPAGQGGTYYLECQVNFYDAQGKLSSGMLAIWKGTNGTKLTNLYNVYTGAEAGHLSFSVSTLAVLSAGDVIGAAATITTTDSGSVTSYGGDGGTRIMGFKLAGV